MTACLAVASLALPVHAATTADGDAVDLGTIVVTASAHETRLRDAPAFVDVITREDLQSRPVLDLADALRGSPGVSLSGVGFSRRGIRIRGMDSEYTLVLVDGKRVSAASDAIAHADFDLGWMPVEAIERIEVVRGPMSSLYGSEALGGVVNIITRGATDRWLGSFGYNGGVVAGGHGGGVYQAGVYAGGPLVPDVLGLSFNAEVRRKDDTEDPSDTRLTEQEGRDAHSGNLTLTWTPDARQRIDASHLQGRERRWRDALQAGTVPYVYESVDHIDRRQSSLSHQGNWAWGDTRIRAYWSTLDRTNRRTRGAATKPQSLVDDIVDAQVSTRLGERHRVTVGGEWRRERLEDDTVSVSGAAGLVHRALLLQDEIDLGDAWSLVVGSRADHHDRFGWHHSPRAYGIFHASDRLTFKGGIGNGFKAPTLKQLSPEYSATGGGGRFTIVGNPALKPETATTMELGATWSGDGWSAQATAFQSDLEDLVQTLCLSDCGIRGRELRSYMNVSRARIRGVELAGDVALPGGFSLDANYNWLQPRDRETGLPLVERPRHGAMAQIAWEGAAWRSALRAEYKGAQWQSGTSALVELPGYTLWSLDLGYRITDRIRLRGGVENLTDERLAETSALYSYPETGRYVHVGVNLGF